MRLKKLFAQRMVHKATASQGDRSSVSEVDGVCMGVRRCLPCPLGCSVSSWLCWPWSLPVSMVPVTQWWPHSLLGQNELVFHSGCQFPAVPQLL